MSLSLEKIDMLITALISNSEELIVESELLFNAGHNARAFSLSHLAREEIAKAQMLIATAVRMLAGASIDWKDLMKRLRGHNEKIISETINNAIFFASLGDAETIKRMVLDAPAVAAHRNNLKNTSLYVELNKGQLSTPAKAISKALSARTIALARMAHSALKTQWSCCGPYAVRKGENIDISKIDSMSFEELINLLQTVGPIINASLTPPSQSEGDQ